MENGKFALGFLLCRRQTLNRCSEDIVEKLSNFEGYIVYKRQVTALKKIFEVFIPVMMNMKTNKIHRVVSILICSLKSHGTKNY